MNTATFLSILKNFFKGLNDFNSEGRQCYIRFDDKGSGTNINNYDYNLTSKIFSLIDMINKFIHF